MPCQNFSLCFPFLPQPPPPKLCCLRFISCRLWERGAGGRAGCLCPQTRAHFWSEAGPPAAGPCHSAGRPALTRRRMKGALGPPAAHPALCLSLASSGDPPRAHAGCPAGHERGQGEGDAAALRGQRRGVWPPAGRPRLPAEGDRPG